MKPECTWCGQYWKGGGKCPDCQTYRYVDGPVLNPETGEAVSQSQCDEYFRRYRKKLKPDK